MLPRCFLCSNLLILLTKLAIWTSSGESEDFAQPIEPEERFSSDNEDTYMQDKNEKGKKRKGTENNNENFEKQNKITKQDVNEVSGDKWNEIPSVKENDFFYSKKKNQGFMLI